MTCSGESKGVFQIGRRAIHLLADIEVVEVAAHCLDIIILRPNEFAHCQRVRCATSKRWKAKTVMRADLNMHRSRQQPTQPSQKSQHDLPTARLRRQAEGVGAPAHVVRDAGQLQVAQPHAQLAGNPQLHVREPCRSADARPHDTFPKRSASCEKTVTATMSFTQALPS